MIRTVGSSGQRLLIIIGGMLLLPAILLLGWLDARFKEPATAPTPGSA